MKFYYKDKLIRTSKNHQYTHAVIDITNGEVKGCRTSITAAQQIINSEINGCEEVIHNAKAALVALSQGKTGYHVKDGRRTWYCKFDPKWHNETVLNEDIRIYTEAIEKVKQNWKIVELEER